MKSTKEMAAGKGMVLAALVSIVFALGASADPLDEGFANPPQAARPQTWWHWMNGNVTKTGITADLEAMKQIGLGGATVVNADCGIPHGNVQFMSPEWRDDFKYTVQEANRLGLNICLENCAGWSSSGGPWNTVTNAMQKITTSEVRVEGPSHFDDALPQPPTKLDYYRDIAVLAYPVPKGNPVRIADFADKAGFRDHEVLSSAVSSDSAGCIPLKRIVDLTAKLGPDGHLYWHVPRGQWIILRVGYTPIGVDNHPAPPEGTGLECDKLSKAALDIHWNGFMQKALDDVGPLAGEGKTFNSSLIDSYEVGDQNWTADFREEFRQRRGYDLLKFLPVFSNRAVENPAVTERFLWDIRRTIADLFAENYYGHFSELCREHGLFSAIEPYTGPFEGLQCGAPDGEVMGEFWAGSQGNPSVKLAASVAHIYGKTIVGTESFTAAPDRGGWEEYPYSLKALGDLMFSEGVNCYTFHRYAMQPWTNHWPGMTMGPYGINLDRTETWWKQGKPWMEYIARCQFLLQQGRPIQDVAYFDGQSAPIERRDGNPETPTGYDFDDVDADVLLNGATVQDGRIMLASGANYAALVLPPSDINMTPSMLECIRKLVRAGATVIGPCPKHSPSLDNYPKCDRQVKKIARELWGNCDGATVLEHQYGKGRIVWGKSLADVLASQNLKPDFEYQGADYQNDNDAKVAYTHRIAGTADIYFVSNQRQHFDSVECTFRVSGKVPELWHPDTGIIEPAPVWSAHDGRTMVKLDFDPAGSVFVIFRHPISGADHVVEANSDIFPESSNPPRLTIQHAVYTTSDGAAGEMDVTAKLSELAQNGRLTVGVDNETFGRDPAMLHPKELRVDYTLDGRHGHTVVPENDTLMLPPDPSLGTPPQWDVSVSPDSSPIVRLWTNCSVQLTTANGGTLRAYATDVPAPQEISGPWNLTFPPNWGAPPSVTLDKLISWTDDTNDGVRYFSGTATYEKEIEIPADSLAAGRQLWLDLGDVKDFAEVSLNGQDYGVLWKPPFKVNITAAAKPGVNTLVVKVTNLWPNRLIGDEQLPEDCEWEGKRLKEWPQWVLDGKPSPTGRFTFTTWHHYTKDSPLLKSGLLGPVTLQSAVLVSAK